MECVMAGYQECNGGVRRVQGRVQGRMQGIMARTLWNIMCCTDKVVARHRGRHAAGSFGAWPCCMPMLDARPSPLHAHTGCWT